MPISQFDRATARQLGQEIEAALGVIAKKHGIQIRYAGGKYSQTSFTAKIESSILNADGSAETPEVRAFKQLAPAYGLEASDIGRSFAFRGRTYTVSGLKPHFAAKAPVIGTRDDGKVFKFRAEDVRMLLKGGAAAQCANVAFV